jgi:hypothetical protein
MFYEPDSSFLSRAQWQLKLSLLPRRCRVSKKTIWLKYAYRGIAVWTGPGDSVEEIRWVSKEEFLFGRIAGRL